MFMLVFGTECHLYDDAYSALCKDVGNTGNIAMVF